MLVCRGRFQETLVGPDHRSGDDEIAGNGCSGRRRTGKTVSGRAGTKPRRRWRRTILRPSRTDRRKRQRLRPRSRSAGRARRRFSNIFPDSSGLPAFCGVALENDDPSREFLFFGESRGRRGRPEVDVPVDSRRQLRALELRGRRHAPDAHAVSRTECADRKKIKSSRMLITQMRHFSFSTSCQVISLAAVEIMNGTELKIS